MENRKKILMIIPNLDFGGAQRDFCKVANGLNQEYEVLVLSFHKVDIPFQLDPPVVFMNVSAGISGFDKMLKFWKRLQILKAIKKDKRIDVSISYLEGANYLNVLSRTKDKVVISTRGSILYDETINGFMGSVRKKFLMPLLYQKADVSVCLNKGIAEELKSIGITKPFNTVIPNGYDVDQIKRLCEEPIDGYEEFFRRFPVIISAGRLAPEKGLMHLLDIYSSARLKEPSLKLVLIGEGVLEDDLVRSAMDHGLKVFKAKDSGYQELLKADVAFFGYTSNPYKFIARSKLLTITSSSEGGPNVLLESILCKTLVLSADCPSGPRERIAPKSVRPRTAINQMEIHENGILLPEFKSQMEHVYQVWVDAILYFLKSEKGKDIVASSYVRVKSDYDESKVISLWEQLIHNRPLNDAN